jgi:peptide/nickel transport system permease protein
MTLSLSLSIIFGTCLGVIAGWKQGKLTDYLLTNVGLVAYSMPVFWSGLLVLFFMGFHLGIIPLGGVKSYGTDMSLMGIIWDRIIHLVGPVLVLCILFTGQFLIIMRNTITDVFSQDFMKMALAKGLKNKTIIFKYAMRNALLPTISLSAALLSLLIGGATMTEVVFSYNGIGRLIYDSVLRRDYPVLQGVFIVMALLVIVGNFIADMLYAYFDPRIKYA